jgi:hypothetical protein
MKNDQKWRRVVLLANASDSDEELAARLRSMMLHNFRIPIAVPGGRLIGEDPAYVPSLAREARRIIPELRALLRGLAGSATRAQRAAATRVLRSHGEHWRIVEEQAPSALAAKLRDLDEEKRNARLTMGKSAWERFAERRRREESWRLKFPERYQTGTYRDTIDPIIIEMIPQVPLRGSVPVRICRLAACGKFFVRRGRRVFCSAGCKAAYHRPHYRMSRAERRDYQVKYRAEKLLRERGRKAIREWMRKLARRRMAPARRRRMMAALRGALA